MFFGSERGTIQIVKEGMFPIGQVTLSPEFFFESGKFQLAVFGIEVINVVRASSECWMDYSILKAFVIPGYNL